MKIKYISSWCLLFILFGCSSSKNENFQQALSNGQIIRNGVALSEYFEAKEFTSNKEVLLHLIVTLGTERVPKEQKVNLSWQDKKLKDRIEEVEEIYISNKSEKPIEIESITLSYFATSRVLLEKAVTIQPKSFYKTKALISTTSIYRAEKHRVLNVTINGTKEIINIAERRMPISELGKNI